MVAWKNAPDTSTPLDATTLNTAFAERAPFWAPATVYTLGQQVVSPNNDVVSANVGHTSAAAYATDVAKWTVSSTYAPLVDPDGIAVGESNMHRRDIRSTAVALASGVLRIGNFTARKTETINTLAVMSGSTAAGATPTLCRIGVWTINDVGALVALVAATANDTSLFGAVNTEYARATLAPFNKVAGQRYGVGVLVVTAAAAPTLMGYDAGGAGGIGGLIQTRRPSLVNGIAGMADLPASSAVVSTAAVTAPYVEMRP